MSGGVAVSVVIPTYQRASLVGRAIDSVLGQDPAPTELIVVDDGSTDETPEVLAGYGDAISVIRQRNAGGAAARNAGVESAIEPWIGFLDSDDLWLPGHLQRLLDAREGTGRSADLYFCDTRESPLAQGGSVFEAAGLQLDRKWVLRSDARGWGYRQHQPTMLQASLVRRSTFIDLGGLWPLLSSRHDTHFFYRILAERPACAVAGIGVAMTSDVPTSRRLTARGSLPGRRYWECTVLLYADLLARRVDPAERRILRDQLARGHKRLARLGWTERRYATAGQSVLRSIGTSPPSLPWSVLRPHQPTPSVARARRRIEAASRATERPSG